MSLAVDIVQACATTAAVVVALGASVRAQKVAQDAISADGRHEVAMRIAGWLEESEAHILAVHTPENWRVPPGVRYGPDTGIKEGDIVAPSQARVGPAIHAQVREFGSIRGMTRLAFGPTHEVTRRLDEVIEAIGHVVDRGVIYAREDGPTPSEYVDNTFRPLVQDLFETLAEACGLRERGELIRRSDASADDHRPQPIVRSRDAV